MYSTVDKIKCSIIIFGAVILGWGVIDVYRKLTAQGVNLLSSYREIGNEIAFGGILLFVCITWYLLGRFLNLFEFYAIYPILACEGIFYLGLKYFSTGSFLFGDKVFEVIIGALERAGMILSLCVKMFTNIHEGTAGAIKWIFIGLIVLIVVGGGIAYIFITVVGLVSVSPILSTLVCTLTLALGYLLSSLCKRVPVFIILVCLISYVLFLFWAHLMKGMDEDREPLLDRLLEVREWFDTDWSEVKWLFISIGLLVLAYFLGFFENLNAIFSSFFSEEYHEITANSSIYEENSMAMMLVISTMISGIIGLVADKVFNRVDDTPSIILVLTKLCCTLFVQAVVAGVATGWVRDFVYSPFSLKTKFAGSVNAFLESCNAKLPSVIFVIVFLLGKLVILVQQILYIVVVIAMIAALVFFGVQCAISVFSCNLIFFTLLTNNISVDSWSPFIMSVVFLLIAQFVNKNVATTRI